MRILLAVLILVHGLIHLMGFVGELSLAKLEGVAPTELPPPWKQLLGVSWLLVTLLFLGTFGAVLLGRPSWWMLGLPAVLLSQGLIFIAWTNAKYGTLANLILLVPLILAVGASRFDHRVDAEVHALFTRARGSSSASSAAAIEALPPPVRRWLERSGAAERPAARVTRLKQSGRLRTAPDAAWMPAVAHQYFSWDPPGFVWRTHVSMLKVLPVEGRDLYAEGRGQMLITLGGLVPIVDGRGERIDQGTLLRFLGELVWTPSAALQPYLRWAPMDERHARVTMSHEGVSGDAELEFDAEGRFVALRARRYMGEGAEAQLHDWRVRAEAWARFDGVEIPSQGVVGWALPEGEFEYYRWTITDLAFDPEGPYPDWRRD